MLWVMCNVCKQESFQTLQNSRRLSESSKVLPQALPACLQSTPELNKRSGECAATELNFCKNALRAYGAVQHPHAWGDSRKRAVRGQDTLHLLNNGKRQVTGLFLLHRCPALN